VLWRGGRRGVASLLALGALAPIVLALGTNLPLYAPLWHALPPFRFPRVPERLMPIAALCLAGLTAAALGRSRRAVVVPLLAVALLYADLHVGLYGHSRADQDNTAYAALRSSGPGRLLELPVFLPDVHYGSVYLYYDQQARRQRPAGYSTTAPVAADAAMRRLERLNCGDWQGVDLRALGVQYVAVHRGLFERNTAVPDRAWFAALGLVRHGFRESAVDGRVSLWRPGRGVAPGQGEPSRNAVHFCQGWYGPRRERVPMSETHAPFWVYGAGPLALWLRAPEPLATRFSVDEREIVARTVFQAERVVLPLGPRRGWHLVALDVPRLAATKPRATGVRLLSITPR